jgi:hypothetical protein
MNDVTGHCYTWEEIEKPFVLIKRHKFSQASQSWEADASWEWRVWRKFTKPFSLCAINYEKDGKHDEELHLVDANGNCVSEKE